MYHAFKLLSEKLYEVHTANNNSMAVQHLHSLASDKNLQLGFEAVSRSPQSFA